MVITGKQLAEQCEIAYQEDWGYIWATAGETWTERKQEALVAKYKADPDKYSDYEQGAKVGSKWIGHRVADCSGLIKWGALQLGLKGIYHGSNSQFNKNCKSTDKIIKGAQIPIGALIFTGTEPGKHNHVGILISETCVLEAKGTAAGVVHTPLSNRKWTYYGLLRDVDYGVKTSGSAAVSKPETKPAAKPAAGKPISYPTLRRGNKGDLVAQMQDLLQKDGSTLEVDGIFGVGTQSAVRSFQKRHGLVVDGIVGPKTWAELLKLI